VTAWCLYSEDETCPAIRRIVYLFFFFSVRVVSVAAGSGEFACFLAWLFLLSWIAR